ncbi:MAG: ferredoxin [Cyanobacteria bacterium NC_groundwater_1444_Ag_S-0.65um_54_12]|nr:ferredoxin [Cyanobacteria bacterium NC_groundwater_1444_Ag_S-0.65um_54_12]
MSRPAVDQGLCIESAICWQNWPDVFAQDPGTGKAYVLPGATCETASDPNTCQDSVVSCPSGAISIVS